MSLYSASLAGVILLVDNRISSFIGIKKGIVILLFSKTGLCASISPWMDHQ